MSRMTGAQIFWKCLDREGVKHVFGLPGGAVLDIYNEHINWPQIKHFLVRHEQAAVHAADGYARASGKVGVAMATSGPGATNTVTGIASAYMDSIPVVVFTGQVPTALIGNDAFQEVDIVGITRSCTKHNYLVKNVGDLARIIHEAFHIARSGRPGPVLVDLPKDVINAKAKPEFPETIKLKSYNPTYHANPRQVKRALETILKAKRPVLYTGGGIVLSDASKELLEFAQALQIPVTSTLMGLGGFPGDHPLWMGMLGMHGTYYANMAVNESDVLIAVGARFDDRVTGKLDEFAPHATIIHIDIDPSSISKNVVVHIPLVGDCKDALHQLNDQFRQSEPKDWGAIRRPWLEMIAGWRQEHPLTYGENGHVKPQFVIEKLWELTQGEAYITTEVGQNQMWAAQFYKFNKPRRLMTSGGLGVMGYGFPAAMGVQAAQPEATVIDIAGDGSFQMNIQEMATVVQYNLPVKVALLNNRWLGMVRQWQTTFYERHYSQTSLEVAPDFVKLAEAYGAVGFRAEKPEEVEPVIREALSVRRPVIMDFRIDPDECVLPFMPPGKTVMDILLA